MQIAVVALCVILFSSCSYADIRVAGILGPPSSPIVMVRYCPDSLEVNSTLEITTVGEDNDQVLWRVDLAHIRKTSIISNTEVFEIAGHPLGYRVTQPFRGFNSASEKLQLRYKAGGGSLRSSLEFTPRNLSIDHVLVSGSRTPLVKTRFLSDDYLSDRCNPPGILGAVGDVFAAMARTVILGLAATVILLLVMIAFLWRRERG